MHASAKRLNRQGRCARQWRRFSLAPHACALCSAPHGLAGGRGTFSPLDRLTCTTVDLPWGV